MYRLQYKRALSAAEDRFQQQKPMAKFSFVHLMPLIIIIHLLLQACLKSFKREEYTEHGVKAVKKKKNSHWHVS